MICRTHFNHASRASATELRKVTEKLSKSGSTTIIEFGDISLARSRRLSRLGESLCVFRGDPVNCADPSDEAVYIVKRRLAITGLGWTYPVLAHVFLACDSY